MSLQAACRAGGTAWRPRPSGGLTSASPTFLHEIREQPGSYDWRAVSGHSVLSTHSFGIAVDINSSGSPDCGVAEELQLLDKDLITDMPVEFVQAFKDEGFAWGGDWTDHPNCHAFRVARLALAGSAVLAETG